MTSPSTSMPPPAGSTPVAWFPWCPWCRVPLPAPRPDACRRCGLVLDDAAAANLMALDQRLSRFEQEEARRRTELAWLFAERRRVAAAATFLRPGPAEPTLPQPSPELRWRSVRVGLLALGATLLVVAGVVFVTLAWPRLDQAGRAGVLVGLTAVALALTLGLRTRLPATAEALAALFIGFSLIDWYAVRQAGAGVGLDLDLWWALGTGVAAGLAFVLGVTVRLATSRVASALLAPTCAVLVVVATASTPLPIALAMTAVACLVVLAALVADRARWLPAGAVLVAGAVVIDAVAAGFALATALGSIEYPAGASAGAIVALGAPMLLARTRSPRATAAFGQLLVAGITVCLLGAAVTMASSVRADQWLLAWSAVAGTAAALFAVRGPKAIRAGTVLGASAYLLIPTMTALLVAVDAVTMPLVWYAYPWRAGPLDHVTQLVTATGDVELRAVTIPGGTGWPAVAVLAVLAAGVAGLAARARRDPMRRLLPADAAIPTSTALVTAAVVVAVNVAGATLAVALAVHVGLCLVLLTSGVIGARREGATWSLVLIGFAALGVVPTLGWAAADRWLTVAGVGSLALAALVAGAASMRPALRTGLIATGVAATLAEGTVIPLAAHVGPGMAGFAATFLGGIALLVGVHLLAAREPLVARAVQVVAVGGIVLTVVVAFAERRWGAGALTVAVPFFLLAGWDRRFELFRDVAALTALGATWSWLAVFDVTTVEAYTLPTAAVTLAAGWRMAVRRGAPTSWRSLGPGLVVGFLPSTIVAVAGHGAWRPVLLFLAASGCVLLGAWRRLQAPIVVGGATVATLAVDVLWPVVARAERWVLLAITGAVFLWLGATIERRRTQAQRAHDVFGRLH